MISTSLLTETYNANFGQHCEYGDLVELLDDPEILIPEADIVIGGPPCQGFSSAEQKSRWRSSQASLDTIS